MAVKPAQPPQPEVEEDDVNPEGDGEPEVEEEVEEEEEAEEVASGFDWAAFEERLGDLPDAPDEKLVEMLDAKAVERMPEHARVALKHVIAKQKAEAKRLADEMAAKVAKLADKEKALNDDARKLHRQMQEQAEVFKSPEFEALRAKIKAASDGDPDPLTTEGQKALIERGVVEAVEAVTKPWEAKAQQMRQVAAYNEFVAEHPEMTDPKFKGEVRDIVKARAEEGRPIRLADAYEIVKGRKIAAEQAAKAEKDRQARARAMRRVSPGGPGGTATTRESPNELAARIMREGYGGTRGAQALSAYYQDNPAAYKAAKALSARR